MVDVPPLRVPRDASGDFFRSEVFNNGDCTIIQFACPERMGLLLDVSTWQQVRNLSVMSATITTAVTDMGDSFAINTFAVSDKDTRRPVDDTKLQALKNSLEPVLQGKRDEIGAGTKVKLEALPGKRVFRRTSSMGSDTELPALGAEASLPVLPSQMQSPRALARGSPNGKGSMSNRSRIVSGRRRQGVRRPDVTVTNRQGDDGTLVLISAQDRPGLLVDSFSTLRECQISVVKAAVQTIDGQAGDMLWCIDSRTRLPLLDSELTSLARKLANRLETNDYMLFMEESEVPFDELTKPALDRAKKGGSPPLGGRPSYFNRLASFNNKLPALPDVAPNRYLRPLPEPIVMGVNDRETLRKKELQKTPEPDSLAAQVASVVGSHVVDPDAPLSSRTPRNPRGGAAAAAAGAAGVGAPGARKAGTCGFKLESGAFCGHPAALYVQRTEKGPWTRQKVVCKHAHAPPGASCRAKLPGGGCGFTLPSGEVCDRLPTLFVQSTSGAWSQSKAVCCIAHAPEGCETRSTRPGTGCPFKLPSGAACDRKPTLYVKGPGGWSSSRTVCCGAHAPEGQETAATKYWINHGGPGASASPAPPAGAAAAASSAPSGGGGGAPSSSAAAPAASSSGAGAAAGEQPIPRARSCCDHLLPSGVTCGLPALMWVKRPGGAWGAAPSACKSAHAPAGSETRMTTPPGGGCGYCLPTGLPCDRPKSYYVQGPDGSWSADKIVCCAGHAPPGCDARLARPGGGCPFALASGRPCDRSPAVYVKGPNGWSASKAVCCSAHAPEGASETSSTRYWERTWGPGGSVPDPATFGRPAAARAAAAGAAAPPARAVPTCKHALPSGSECGHPALVYVKAGGGGVWGAEPSVCKSAHAPEGAETRLTPPPGGGCCYQLPAGDPCDRRPALFVRGPGGEWSVGRLVCQSCHAPEGADSRATRPGAGCAFVLPSGEPCDRVKSMFARPVGAAEWPAERSVCCTAHAPPGCETTYVIVKPLE